MFKFEGVGLFFNQVEDLSRIEALAMQGSLQWIAPLMAPDQSAVQHNRQEWQEWYETLHKLGVMFCPWLVCDDPTKDAASAEYLAKSYPCDGMVFNCEKSYESSGKWKAEKLCAGIMDSSIVRSIPKLLSYPATPAERYDMDYRSFERAGFLFAPQAYWNDPSVAPGQATPRNLFMSTYLPNQIHVGRDYRIQLFNVVPKHWCRVVQQISDTECIIKDLNTAKEYILHVEVKTEGTFKYMVIADNRYIYTNTPARIRKGKLLGFQARDKIYPTCGLYEPLPTVADVQLKVSEVPGKLRGVSGYLGETSTSAHVNAMRAGMVI